MLRVGIAGSTGYTGEELIKVLLRHSGVKINCLASKIDKPVKISQFFPYLSQKLDLICDDYDAKVLAENSDIVFLALPHTVSMDFVPFLIKEKKKIVDLSADYRFTNLGLYKKWYEVEHKDKQNAAKAVYGLPEIFKKEIKQSILVANPGCYPTAAILGVAPLMKLGNFEIDQVIIDAKSGYSGAGRIYNQDELEKNILNNFKAYKVTGHRHAPEIAEKLSIIAKREIKVLFVPHLLPIERGILETIYIRQETRNQNTETRLVDLYREFYSGEPFVRVLDEGSFPELKNIQNTNFCHIGLQQTSDCVIIVVAIDNLLKGASGQAVQNMNIMCGFKETEGLL